MKDGLGVPLADDALQAGDRAGLLAFLCPGTLILHVQMEIASA